ncbi:hypothetical protein AAGW05_00095 [Arthrobacter sp. LAPM80]|uniref:hypothetical protein n=1 Tax=Arthrobacter sp. LAPM80 TaxID=3141788 RepID=UPI00398A5FD5
MKPNFFGAGLMVVLLFVLLPVGIAQFTAGSGQSRLHVGTAIVLLVGLLLAALPPIMLLGVPLNAAALRATDWRSRAGWYFLFGVPLIGFVIIVVTTAVLGLNVWGAVAFVAAGVIPFVIALLRLRSAR